MGLVPSDKARGLKTPVWDTYKEIVNKAEGKEVSVPLIKGHLISGVKKKILGNELTPSFPPSLPPSFPPSFPLSLLSSPPHSFRSSPPHSHFEHSN